MAKRPTAADKQKADRIEKIRQAILDQLKAQKRTSLWLSQQVKSVHIHTAQAFLYSGRDIRVSALAEMMELVGLKLSKGRPVKKAVKA